LLLILALSLGVFAVSYASTWSGSQQDQAAYQAGADVRAATNGTTGKAVPAAEYDALPGVQAAMPVERIEHGVSLVSGSVDMLAVDSELAPTVVHFRADEAPVPFTQLMGTLHAGEPTLELVTLPQDAQFLQVDPELDISSIEEMPSQIFLGQDVQPVPIDPSTLTDLKVGATATVRDAHGLLYRVASPQTPMTTAATPIVVSLQQAGTSLDGPVELIGLEFDVFLPSHSQTLSAQIGVAGLQAGPGANGPWTALPTSGWSARLAAQGSNVPQPVPADTLRGMVLQVNDPSTFLFGAGATTPDRLIFTAAPIASWQGTVPVLANPAFLSSSGTQEGQTIAVTIDGVKRNLLIAGTVETFPTTDPMRPLLIFDEATLDLMRIQATAGIRNADEWWLSVDPDQSARVATALSADPFDSPTVVSALDRTHSLSTDPVALGIIGALVLGFVATAIFALVALVVSAAVSARQRRTEFALLRALGLSGGQLSRWLWLENGSLVVISLICGTAVGVVISWIALPFITVTQQATTPVPPVVVDLPWDRIIALDVIVLVAMGIAVAVLAVVLRRLAIGSALRMGED